MDSFTIEDIKMFIQAGYTKSDIDALINQVKPIETGSNDPDNKPNETMPLESPTMPLESRENTKPIINHDDTSKALQELTRTVEALVKAQQASNRANTSNTAKVMSSTDDILANLINKPNK